MPTWNVFGIGIEGRMIIHEKSRIWTNTVTNLCLKFLEMRRLGCSETNREQIRQSEVEAKLPAEMDCHFGSTFRKSGSNEVL